MAASQFAQIEAAEAGFNASDADASGLRDQPLRSWKKVAGATAGAMALCAAAGVAAARLGGGATSGAALAALQQKQQIIAMPGPDMCSDWKDDCLATGCCEQSGFRCFVTDPPNATVTKAKCMKGCVPSEFQACTQPQVVMDPILQDATPVATSFYCFSTYMADRGEDHPAIVDELGNLQMQFRRKIGIFLCEEWQVFSDGEAELAPGVPFVKVDDVDGDFHFAKRKSKRFGAWVNTGMHTQAWKAIVAEGKYAAFNWVIKVDADAVFIPSRLRPVLDKQMVPATGVYLENCPHVDYGYYGNQEIFSKVAFETLVANIDSCKSSLPWKIGVKGGKWGPMGEDLFAQQCLDSLNVRRAERYDVSTDGACEYYRPEDQKKNKSWIPDCSKTSTPQMHPFFTPDVFEPCYDATIAAFGY